MWLLAGEDLALPKSWLLNPAPTSKGVCDLNPGLIQSSTPPPSLDSCTLRCSSMVLFWAKSRGQDGHLKTLTRWGSKCWSKCEERRGL